VFTARKSGPNRPMVRWNYSPGFCRLALQLQPWTEAQPPMTLGLGAFRRVPNDSGGAFAVWSVNFSLWQQATARLSLLYYTNGAAICSVFWRHSVSVNEMRAGCMHCHSVSFATRCEAVISVDSHGSWCQDQPGQPEGQQNSPAGHGEQHRLESWAWLVSYPKVFYMAFKIQKSMALRTFWRFSMLAKIQINDPEVWWQVSHQDNRHGSQRVLDWLAMFPRKVSNHISV